MVTKTTTECDKCGAACVNGCVRIRMTTEHWTNQRIEVGEDYYEPLELCLTCGGVAREVLGIKPQQMPEPIEQPIGQDIVAPRPIALMPGVEMHRRGPVMERDERGPDRRGVLEGELR